MRLLPLALAVALVALPPAASASQPRDPFEGDARLDRDPVAGEPVTLTVTVRSVGGGMAHGGTLRLDLAEWVRAAEPLEFDAPAGEKWSITRSWTLTPERTGFWAARVVFTDDTGFEAWCCLRAWSGDGEASWTTRYGKELMPRADFDARFEGSVGADGRALAVQEVVPERAWMRDATVEIRLFGLGNPGADQRSVRGAGNGTVRAELPLDVAPGEVDGVRRWAFVGVRYDGGPHWDAPLGEERMLLCAVAEVTRDGEGAPAWRDEGECDWPNRIPGPAVAASLAALGGAVFVRGGGARRPPVGR